MLASVNKSIQARAVDELCDRFESSLRKREQPSIKSWLNEAGDLGEAALPELVALALEYRLQFGERATAGEYLERYPALEADAELAVRLVAAEFRATRKREPNVDESEFRQRYPELARRPEWSNGPWIELAASAQTVDQEGSYAPSGAERGSFFRELLLPALEPGEIGRMDKYRVFGVLGEGGMGVVLQGEEMALGRPVAIKLMMPDPTAPHARARFEREARAAAAVEHPRIVIIYAVGEFKETPYLVMPLMKGRSLGDRLAQAGPLPLHEAVRYAREMAEGLTAAHERGLIHRDIKPDNVWLEHTAEGAHVRLLDFGLVSTGEGERLTRSNAIIGTPAYMAPEQAGGEKVDVRADLFSLGCVLYQMATGQKAFSGPSTMAILSALANHQPPSANTVSPAVPVELSALIDRLLCKDPKGRPGSAADVVSALRIIEFGLPENTPTGAIPLPKRADAKALSAPTELKKRRPWGIGAVVAVTAIAVVAALALRHNNGQEPLTGLVKGDEIGHKDADRPPTKEDSEGKTDNPPVVGFRIKRPQLEHYQAKDDQTLGVLGRDSYAVHLNDKVRVKAELTQPGYGYLLVFRADGKFDLCLRDDEDETPRRTESFVYNPTKPTSYGLNEGEGLWVFAVVASEKPLPPFKRWVEIQYGSAVSRLDNGVYESPSHWKVSARGRDREPSGGTTGVWVEPLYVDPACRAPRMWRWMAPSKRFKRSGIGCARRARTMASWSRPSASAWGQRESDLSLLQPTLNCW